MREFKISKFKILWLLLLAACTSSTQPVEDFTVSTPVAVVRATPAPAALEESTRPQHAARDNDLQFSHLTYHQGLSQVSVLDILQDSQGFLWFGTADGLNRYDGGQMTVYRHNPQDARTLSGSYCLTLYEDRAGNLWVGTASDGLNRFDRETGTFTRYQRDYREDTYSLHNNTINVLHEDHAGTLWIGTDNGLSTFNPEIEGFERVWIAELEKQPVYALYADRGGLLWVGTEQGLYYLDPDAPSEIHSLPDLQGQTIQALYEDTEGRLWIGGDGGLARLERPEGAAPEAGVLTHYVHDAQTPSSLSKATILDIVEDREHTLWMGTDGGGLQRLLTLDASADAQFIHYRYDPNEGTSLSDDVVQALYLDREGVLWIGTYQGALNKYDTRAARFVNYQYVPGDPYGLQGRSVWAVAVDHDGVLWVGTDQGLNRLISGVTETARHLQMARFIHYRHSPTDTQSLSGDFVRAIHEDRAGHVWVGTTTGLNRWDRTTGGFVRYLHDPDDPQSLSNNFIITLYEDSQGALWIGTMDGLNRLAPQDVGPPFLNGAPSTTNFTRYTYQANDKDGLSDSIVRAIYEDHTGDLWVGTSVGLNRFNPKKQEFRRYYAEVSEGNHLSSNYILSLYEDRTGALWIGTYQGGLNRLDPEREIFTVYHLQDGLPNGVVYGILGDAQGYLWLSTNQGLAKFNPQTEIFETYDVEDGLQSNEFNAGAYAASRDDAASADGAPLRNGGLLFGGMDGVSAFMPEEIVPNPVVPPIVLTSLSQSGADVVSDKAVASLDAITFKWPHNFFEFEFAALSYVRPEKNQYAYRLDPFDQDWVYLDTQHAGRYTNLPGGTYTLRLKGSNDDGVWNEEGTALTVTIIPPFWATWGFRGAVALLVSGIVVGGYRWRLRSIEARARDLEHLVTARTTELSQANVQLKEEIVERERAEAALARQAAEAAVAAERNRLARDLHDAVTQTLFSASLIADVLPRLWDKDPELGRQQAEEIRALTRGALAEMRALLLELRPEGVVEAQMGDLLEQLGHALRGRIGVPVTVSMEGDERLPPEVQVALYRIAQEALNNVGKYAEADRVRVLFQSLPERVVLSVKDNGRGFVLGEVPAGHFGLAIMRERASAVGAELDIRSAVGVGTEIRVVWARGE